MRYGWCILLCMLAGCGQAAIPPAAEIVLTAGVVSDLAPPQFSPGDWPAWRGVNNDGVAEGPAVPVEWDETKNVVWKTKLPGRGHSSPIVLGERIYLATADEQTQIQSVMAIDRRRGKPIWQTDLHTGGFEREMHGENSQASSTLATDGERLFAVFLNNQRIWCSALDLEGQELWRKDVGGFRSRFGYSASPVVYQSLVIIAADHQDGGFIAALDRHSSEFVWRRNRAKVASYGSPRVVRVDGRDLVVFCGGRMITAYDPLTGEQRWTTAGTSESTVGTPVVSDNLVILSGGFPESDTVALQPDGTVAWRNREKSYVPSMLVHQGCLVSVNDDGIARCWEAATGRERWKHRVGGNFRASPIVSGEHIFVTSMTGTTTVFRAISEKFELVAENHLGAECFASPAVSEGQLFLRVADDSGGRRQESLYCIGATDSLRTSRASRLRQRPE